VYIKAPGSKDYSIAGQACLIMKREVQKETEDSTSSDSYREDPEARGCRAEGLDLPLLVFSVSTDGLICQKRRACHVAIARTNKEAA